MQLKEMARPFIYFFILIILLLTLTGAMVINGVEFFPSAKIGASPTNHMDVSGDGTITLYGSARVKRSVWITAEGLKAPGVQPATSADLGISSAWEFADALDKTITGKIGLPYDMDKSGDVVLHLGWCSPVVDPGDSSKKAYWQLFYRFTSSDEGMDGTADQVYSLESVASTSANGLTFADFDISSDMIDAGDHCILLQIKRRADQTPDTIDGSVIYLNGVCFEYFSDKLGTNI